MQIRDRLRVGVLGTSTQRFGSAFTFTSNNQPKD